MDNLFFSLILSNVQILYRVFFNMQDILLIITFEKQKTYVISILHKKGAVAKPNFATALFFAP